MIPDAAATTSTPAQQAAAPGPQPTAPASPASPASAAGSAPGSQPAQPAPATPASQPTPVQLLWEVATLAFELMRRLVHVLQPIQQYYPKPALLLARLLIDIPRIFLTLRYAPERATKAQLRHLTRARHLLQALFNYSLPLGPRTSPSANATANQHPSATPLGARTPSSATTPSPAISAVPSLNPSPSATPGAHNPSSSTSATPSIREVPEVPMVAGVAHVPAAPAVDHNPLTPSPASHDSHPSQDSHPSHSAFPDPQSTTSHSAFCIQHSAFSPYVPDFHTLAQALKADSLPANCAGALFEDPGDALVRALHQLHTIYFSLYPNQSPSPSPVQSPSHSPSQSSASPHSAFRIPNSDNLQSGTPQSDAPSVNPVNPVNQVNQVNPVNPVNSVHSPSPAQSEISNLKSEIPNPDSSIPHSEFRILHSDAPLAPD